MRVALIDDNHVVTNVAEFPDDWTGDEWDGYTAVHLDDDTATVGPGWVRTSGGTFAAPTFPDGPPPVEERVDTLEGEVAETRAAVDTLVLEQLMGGM